MRTFLLTAMVVGGFSALCSNVANAQDAVVVEEDVTTLTVSNLDCKDRYYSTSRDNWFIQLGAGINSPFVENHLDKGDKKHHITASYNLGFGKWMSPYLGWRMSMYYSMLRWDNGVTSTAQMANANFDLMWDMLNTCAGPNSKRVFSIVPFVGIGGTYTWDFNAPASLIQKDGGKYRKSAWTLPVSAGLQFRFRLCDYCDFFLEGRASFYGDNFNLCAYGEPVDVNITATGGFIFNIGGSSFKSYNPCSDLAYISSLNSQINALRGDLAATATALAVAESQLPCPEVNNTISAAPQTVVGPVMTTVRFTINSAKISPEEMVNVYNVATYLKENPSVNLTIQGYADKNTGTSAYNKELSARRAQAVYDALTKTYGIDGSRLSIQAEGSAVQPYDTNNWNRIVIFVPGN